MRSHKYAYNESVSWEGHPVRAPSPSPHLDHFEQFILLPLTPSHRALCAHSLLVIASAWCSMASSRSLCLLMVASQVLPAVAPRLPGLPWRIAKQPLTRVGTSATCPAAVARAAKAVAAAPAAPAPTRRAANSQSQRQRQRKVKHQPTAGCTNIATSRHAAAVLTRCASPVSPAKAPLARTGSLAGPRLVQTNLTPAAPVRTWLHRHRGDKKKTASLDLYVAVWCSFHSHHSSRG